jgi:uncharacterized protein (TIRG00374 family)
MTGGDLTDRTGARNRILNILKVLVTVVGLGIVLLTQDLNKAFQLLREMEFQLFLGALLLFLSGLMVRAYRWGSLVWALGVKVNWWRLVGLNFVGVFFGLFLPTGVGGDAVKMYELTRDEGKAAAAISSVLVDRFLGLFVLFAMALLALASSYQLVPPEVRIFIAVLFVGCLGGVALLLQRKWIEAWGRRLGLDRLLSRFNILRELYDSIHLYGARALLRATAASVVWNLILILAYYLLGLAVGVELSLGIYFLLVPVISALLVIPSIGGLGIREGATVFLLKQMGVDDSQALALALAYDLILVITAMVGAFLYILQGMRGVRR